MSAKLFTVRFTLNYHTAGQQRPLGNIYRVVTKSGEHMHYWFRP